MGDPIDLGLIPIGFLMFCILMCSYQIGNAPDDYFDDATDANKAFLQCVVNCLPSLPSLPDSDQYSNNDEE